ncbi:hypothetical protein LTS08_004747 [Lithohypha guttulata]|nr:hypothetical protein LTS08_004747 [Lithohypha guttulata]
MPSEDDIRTFPDGSAESMAGINYLQTGADRTHQWLGTSTKKDKRRRKSIKLSISAPMAKSPMSAITEQTESVLQGTPDPVEMPTHTTPKATPEKIVIPVEPLPIHRGHAPQRSGDNLMDMYERNHDRTSIKVHNANPTILRSLSMGSITSPPDCPLPPVPEGSVLRQEQGRTMSRSKSDLSTDFRKLSLLNSPLDSNQLKAQRPRLSAALSSHAPNSGFAGFNFGLSDENLQVVKVVEEHDNSTIARQLTSPTFCISRQTSPTRASGTNLRTIDASSWNVPKGYKHVAPPRTIYTGSEPELDSRPVSAISASSFIARFDPQSAPSSLHSSPSRPVSVSSADFFRLSVIGPSAPDLAPDSPRTRGHKRQNCVRISGLTPIDTTKKRLSSQLHRLAEAEEDDEDNRSFGIEIPTISPARPKTQESPAREEKTHKDMIRKVPTLRQPQARSLRIKRPGLLDREGTASPSPTKRCVTMFLNQIQPEEPSQSIQSPLERPLNPLTRPKTAEPRFVYAGSPSSDPTRTLPSPQDFSPVSPPAALRIKPAVLAVDTPEKASQPASQATPVLAYSPASTSILYSANASPAQQQHDEAPPSHAQPSSSPHRQKAHTLHGPRTAPPTSLRTRNTSRAATRLRQTSDQRSTSPIRKASQSRPSVPASSHQDDLRRSIALLKSLTYAAEAGKGGGIPEVNVVRSRRSPSLGNDTKGVARTPSSQYADSPFQAALPAPVTQLRGTRQRSKTVDSSAPSLPPPWLRPEATYPPHDMSNGNTGAKFPHSSSNISIWEDASVKGDSDSETKASRHDARNGPRPSVVKQHQRALTSHALLSGSAVTRPDRSTQVVKEPLWKPQQSVDSLNARALAFNSNTRTPPTDGRKQEQKTKLDGFWGDGTQSQAPHHSQDRSIGHTTAIKTRAASGVMGPRPRQRSHTVSAAPRPQLRNEFAGRMAEGVGLGVDFGRTGLGAGMNTVSERRNVFLNKTERDGIGRLR